MRKLRTVLVLLLAAALLAALAAMPKIVAAVQDGSIMGRAQFEQVRSVQLEIRQNIPSLGKLALMGKMDGVIEIPEESASLSAEEAQKLAYSVLDSYIAKGLMEPFEHWTYEARPLLASGDPELSGIFWDVVIVGDPEVFYCVQVAIDDETGKLLRINFTSNYLIQESEQEEFLYDFADLYFNGLDISEYGQFATDDLEEEYVGDNGVAVRYCFGDLVYGEINVDLHVYNYGFYTEFPDQ